jgi:hypothetical protein
MLTLCRTDHSGCRTGAWTGTIAAMLRFTHFGLAACLAVTFACGPFPTEAATTEGSEGSESGTTTTAESESGSASMSGDGDGDSGDGDGDGDSGDGDGDGDSGDGDGDGDSGDGDGDGDSGDGDGDTGDGDGDSGDGDGDGDSGDGDGDNTGDGDGDGDNTGDGDGDGDGGQDYYGDCSMGNMCLNDEYCFEDNGDNYQVCSQNCNNVGDCPDVPGHSLKCIGLNFNFVTKRCFISCEGNEDCPMGMDCQGENFDIDFICVYR